MPKTKITEGIETALNDMCRSKRLYGCEEVTIGFPNNGHGNEIVDFMTMDSKGIIRCYEIKISLPDLKSKAKKSWYGHYNYLVITEDLYHKVPYWSIYIPDHIGVMVYSGNELCCKRRPIEKELSSSDQLMIKEGLIRSLTWKMWKYRDAADMEKVRGLKAEIQDWKRKFKQEADERTREFLEMRKYRHAIRKYRKLTGIDVEKYIENIEKQGAPE